MEMPDNNENMEKFVKENILKYLSTYARMYTNGVP